MTVCILSKKYIKLNRYITENENIKTMGDKGWSNEQDLPGIWQFGLWGHSEYQYKIVQLHARGRPPLPSPSAHASDAQLDSEVWNPEGGTQKEKMMVQRWLNAGLTSEMSGMH